MTAMTNEERLRSLCRALRTANCNYTINGEPVTQLAANELERLAEELQYQYACDKTQQEEIKRLSALAHRRAVTPNPPK